MTLRKVSTHFLQGLRRVIRPYAGAAMLDPAAWDDLYTVYTDKPKGKMRECDLKVRLYPLGDIWQDEIEDMPVMTWEKTYCNLGLLYALFTSLPGSTPGPQITTCEYLEVEEYGDDEDEEGQMMLHFEGWYEKYRVILEIHFGPDREDYDALATARMRFIDAKGKERLAEQPRPQRPPKRRRILVERRGEISDSPRTDQVAD